MIANLPSEFGGFTSSENRAKLAFNTTIQPP
jgi:hypothetical protein